VWRYHGSFGDSPFDGSPGRRSSSCGRSCAGDQRNNSLLSSYWSQKCGACREYVARTHTPSRECINCWKIEVWSKSPVLLDLKSFRSNTTPQSPASAQMIPGRDPEDTHEGEPDSFSNREFLESLVHGVFSRILVHTGGKSRSSIQPLSLQRFAAKTSKHPIQVVVTGIPRDAYPAEATDYLLMLYASNIEERDFLRNLLCDVLSLGREHAGKFPVRRGCWVYEDILGPWPTWYPVDRDFCESAIQ